MCSTFSLEQGFVLRCPFMAFLNHVTTHALFQIISEFGFEILVL